MFDIEIFLTLLIPVLLAQFATYISFKKEISDLSSSSKHKDPIENYRKILIRRKIKKNSRVFFILLYIFLLILFIWPHIITIIKDTITIDWPNFNTNIFSDIKNFLLKFTPFKNDFSLSFKFKFSYITGIVLSIIIEFICSIVLSVLEIRKKTSKIIIFFLILYGLIWINNFISLFLSEHINIFYVFFSLIINIIVYTILGIILFFALVIFSPDAPKDEKNVEQ